MALIPDRRHNEQGRRDADAASPAVPVDGGAADEGPADGEFADCEPDSSGLTYRELLEAAGLDLTDHPLADHFDAVADLSDDDDATAAPTSCEDPSNPEHLDSYGRPRGAKLKPPETDAEVAACIERLETEQEAWRQKRREERQAQRDAEHAEFLKRNPQRRGEFERADAEWRERVAAYEQAKKDEAEAERQRAERYRAVVEEAESTAAAHPLLDEYRWSDLKHIVPEIAEGIESLQGLLGDLNDFTRPMGPDDAVTVLDGLETLNRVTEALSIVTLSVFERVGTPRDYGAKNTKALVQNRLNLSSREAHRRIELAGNLGKRVSFSGQSIDPRYPVLSAALRNGHLSSNQASTIIRCLGELPPAATDEQRLEAERILVDKAPSVRVRDISALMQEILAWIDPDGTAPEEEADREQFNVNLRQMKDGTWTLRGRLDPEAGGILNGLLTSRIKTEDEKAEQAAAHKGTATDHGAVDESVAHDDQAVVDAYTEVLRGDRSDRLDPSLDFSAVPPTCDGEVPQGVGIREDGSMIAMADQQPSVRRRIYERFSSLIGSIEMNRIKAGAAYALVVTAKAEDLVNQTGRAVTGVEAPFPITSAAREGLNGNVFFHLMGKKAQTMELATERRLATAKQLAILASRDQGCSFPGCDTPPGWCEAHHIVAWADGGKTDIANLTLACGAHHALIDQSDWHTVMLTDGRPAWVPPASLDPARRPILHARFIARDISETLFGERTTLVHRGRV